MQKLFKKSAIQIGLSIDPEMKQRLQKPENWQDFESLCLNLWGEIWDVADTIKKNGRPGQKQAGVDIYAVPKGKENYWGIQCKCKDDNAKLLKTEIEKIIQEAAKFKPRFEGLIIASTSDKDADIEEYVREKDLENRNKGKFQIHLFCWEDIVERIRENKRTYQYYFQNQQFKTRYNVLVHFGDKNIEKTIHPIFIKRITKYEIREPHDDILHGIIDDDVLQRALNIQPSSPIRIQNEINHSKCQIEIFLSNIGNEVIRDWQLEFSFDGQFMRLNRWGDGDFQTIPDIFMSVDGNVASYSPKPVENVIVQDAVVSMEIFITPFPENYIIPVRWKLLASDYSADGEMTLIVNPSFEEKINIVWVDPESAKRDDVVRIEEKKEVEE